MFAFTQLSGAKYHKDLCTQTSETCLFCSSICSKHLNMLKKNWTFPCSCQRCDNNPKMTICFYTVKQVGTRKGEKQQKKIHIYVEQNKSVKKHLYNYVLYFLFKVQKDCTDIHWILTTGNYNQTFWRFYSIYILLHISIAVRKKNIIKI